MTFSRELKEPAFKPREFLANQDAQMLAEELLTMKQSDFSKTFRKSPMRGTGVITQRVTQPGAVLAVIELSCDGTPSRVLRLEC